MKKVGLTVLIVMLISSLVCIISFIVYKTKYNKNKQEAQEILRVAYNQINNTNETISSNNEIMTFDGTEIENDIIGILIIDKLNIEAPIKEGTSQEVMRTSIGHFIESDYWDGNVSLASHNSGTSMHYFQDLHQLDIGDEITYKTCLGERRYSVESTTIIDDTDWAMVIKNNNLNEDSINTITLITCINGKPDKRLCVRGVEIEAVPIS